jgi:hypothetical protein
MFGINSIVKANLSIFIIPIVLTRNINLTHNRAQEFRRAKLISKKLMVQKAGSATYVDDDDDDDDNNNQ